MTSQRVKLILVAGLPASGKTSFAGALAKRLNAAHINSDTLRTRLNLRGHYDPKSKQQVYKAMLDKGSKLLSEGSPIVVDSTFYKKKLRAPWLQLAETQGADCHFIELKIPEETSRQRLGLKRKDSEADWEVYLKLKNDWEEIEFPHLTLDSHTNSLEEMLKMTEDYLNKKS